MNLIIALFLLITIFHTACTQVYPKALDCGEGTNMDPYKRRDAFIYHNDKRQYLATGYPDPQRPEIVFPEASDMSVMRYDCNLENEAYEIAKRCEKDEELNFYNVSSNKRTRNGDFFPSSFIEETVDRWWNTGLRDGPLVRMTPFEENKAMIPFLQIANGKSNKFGCAYHVCNGDGSGSKFLSFVCKYGQPKSNEKEFNRQYRRLNREWVKTAKAAGLEQKVIRRLKIDLPVCPVLYLLIKTHKLATADELNSIDPNIFKVRPIISCVGGPTDRITWFINLILVQLLKYIPAHLSNTRMFLDHLNNVRPNNTHVMESFDVTSLYTNLSNDSAMQAVFELITEHQQEVNMYGLSIGQLMHLIKECVRCSIFRWSGTYYTQIRGLAMGQRLAPSLAIAYMSRIEAPLFGFRPLLYCRYIDDCFVICSTQEQMDKCFELLNEQSEHIKFTREIPSKGWLPFLDVQINLTMGSHITKWYRKPSNKNILVHFSSAHPKHMKRALLGNMFRKASSVCTGKEEKMESLDLAKQIANSNGYDTVNTQRRFRKRDRPQDETSRLGKKVSIAIRRCLRRAKLENLVSIIEIPPDSLKHQLIRNRLYDRLCMTTQCIVCPNGKDGDCMSSGVVYLISCKECGEEYIFETGRPLCVRIKEHLDGKRRSIRTTPLGAHRAQRHNDVDFEICVKILAHEGKTSARKFLEAFWINAKTPAMNRKDECLTVMHDLAPYIKTII